jgi:hypothetical protein
MVEGVFESWQTVVEGAFESWQTFVDGAFESWRLEVEAGAFLKGPQAIEH